MNDDFDKEMSSLYQQRKAQIEAPTVVLPSGKAKNRVSVFKSLAILLCGGVSSFGIFALMSHLAKAPTPVTIEPQLSHQVIVLPDVIIDKNNADTVINRLPLPEKPIIATLPTGNDNSPYQIEKIEPSVDNNLTFDDTNTVHLPDIDLPQTSINPIVKVLPEYPQELLANRQTGIVKMRYQVAEDGRVFNIEVIEQSGARQFRRAAQKALGAWQYDKQLSVNDTLEVVFEFQLEAKE
ncbi:energy transducer TonB [Thalassotalea hakodatensis]|uniref:energy transducer TonB n=1 Tax=Thalassotalea hakodatensis TaxID=3030492 RepID=UPI00257245B9|nr:energy transducer TonB [Thalassotalea hakodatensis]